MDSTQFQERLKALRQDYLAQLPNKASQIRRLWGERKQGNAAEQFSEMYRLAHNMAGSGATFGCQEIGSVAERLEQLLKNELNQTDPISAQQESLISSELEALEAAIRRCTEPGARSASEAILPTAPAPAAGLSPAKQPGLLYLVEDDAEFAAQFVERLASHDYQVQVFDDFPALLTAVKTAIPLALVMDMVLPGDELGGAAFARELHEKAGKVVPLIFLSVRDDFESRLAAVRAGATHYLTKPLDVPRLVRILEDYFGGDRANPYRVLVVDDDAPLADMYRMYLEDAGLSVAVIHDPFAAMEGMTQFAPDLVLMDINMRGCDGLELASIIRQHEVYDQVPIVFLTTDGHTDRKLAAMNLGGDEFLTKPVLPWNLVTAVQARIKRARALRHGAMEIQKALHELEFLQQAIDQHAIVSMTDSVGRITYVNDKFCEISGYTREELLGQDHRMVKSGDHTPEFYERMWATIASGKVWQSEVKNRKKNGEPYWVEATVVPFLDDFGVPQRYISVRTDITALKLIETSLRTRERDLVEAEKIAHLGRWALQLDSGKVEWSSEVYRAMGLEPGQAEPDHNFFMARVPLEDAVLLRAAEQILIRDGLPMSVDHRVIWPDGSVHWLHSEAYAVRDEAGHVSALRGIVQDITQRKLTEAALVQASNEADRANRAKSDFLASMSHELRTPMNAILGFAQLLESDSLDPLSKEQKESVDQILRAGWHLLELINEVLDLAKVESGRIELSIESVDPVEVIAECADLIVSMAANRQIQVSNAVTRKGEYMVRADRIRLKQALLNLLSNAIKYNREQGRVAISVRQPRHGRLRICVEDTGVGLSEQQLQQLFQPFNRLGAELGAVEGTGIGLVITKRIVELMGGEVDAESVQGEGSTFCLELDSQTDIAIGEVPEHPVQHDADDAVRIDVQRTVLYVEDNPANLRLVAHLLSRRPNIRLLSAHTGDLGVELARSKQPDLIVMDINLPGMDGYETRSRLGMYPETKGIPVIALSANAMPRDIEKGLQAGFARYLTKPIQVEEFMRSIDDFLFDDEKGASV